MYGVNLKKKKTFSFEFSVKMKHKQHNIWYNRYCIKGRDEAFLDFFLNFRIFDKNLLRALVSFEILDNYAPSNIYEKFGAFRYVETIRGPFKIWGKVGPFPGHLLKAVD